MDNVPLPPGFRLVEQDGVGELPPGFQLVERDASAPKYAEQDRRITELQKPGAAQRFLRGTLGLGGVLDEAGAAMDAVIHYVTGGRTGEAYDESLARRRDAIAQSDADNPIRNTVEGIVGGVATSAGMPFLRPFGAGTGMATQAANAGVNAAGGAAVSGFTEGEGGFVNRLENAIDYGTTAAPLGMAGGAALSRLQARAGPQIFGAQIAREAQNIGMTVPTFMEGGRAGQTVAAKLGAIPFVGDDINAAVQRSRVDAGQAAQNIADTVAPGVSAREAGEAASGAMQNWAGNGARAAQNRAYDAVDRQMANVVAPLSATTRTAAALAADGFEAAAPIHARALAEVQEALGRPNGLSFPGISRLRTRIGTLVDNSIDPENRTARAGLQRIYAALTDDMEAAIATNGGQAAQRSWQRANAVARQVAERRDVVAKIVGAQGDKAGEGIVDKIVTMASTKSTADFARLQQARRIMGADAWRGMASNAINRMGRNASNEFVPATFLKNYSALSQEGRRLLFQSTGNNDLYPALESLANVSRRLSNFDRLGNPSGTGGVTALLAALGGAASGDMGVTFATALGGRGIGMLMSRPAVVRAVTNHARLMARFANDRRTQAAVAASAANLARLVAKETGEDQSAVESRILATGRPN